MANQVGLCKLLFRKQLKHFHTSIYFSTDELYYWGFMYSSKKPIMKMGMTISKGQSSPHLKCLTFLLCCTEMVKLLLSGDRRAEIAASDYSNILGIPNSNMLKSNLLLYIFIRYYSYSEFCSLRHTTVLAAQYSSILWWSCKPYSSWEYKNWSPGHCSAFLRQYSLW